MLGYELKRYRIILASRSLRRRQLLEELGLEFTVVEKDYDETFPDNLSGEATALWLAGRKAALFRNSLLPDEIVITADTVVWCGGRILDKPSGEEEAREMIRILSGKTHEVITGVNLMAKSAERIFSDTTRVTFGILSEEEISYYVENFRPYDKAGAYGIQEWIGLVACSRIEGSYFNVVGLPVHLIYRELRELIKNLN
ncbi:MAG TPA: Maf family nucleotide pyrophosphatase [Bacteroidales bacterium]|jgi:septum formation protein|nr:Maf family nucleotide pyrophosphatase [Bacteroidales bacterium]HOS72413.1 Maf family nucleotide pyrophosphatase [Bacteroidales bacterium]HQH24470.1 Maf family nucleotide pyrophosphatase [Bacteroidales bacterium]HQJ82544.1 Maf family nucleotide pyrophosphatase [Bacteroidales bacterium]